MPLLAIIGGCLWAENWRQINKEDCLVVASFGLRKNYAHLGHSFILLRFFGSLCIAIGPLVFPKYYSIIKHIFHFFICQLDKLS
jgi:hypothetical protein